MNDYKTVEKSSFAEMIERKSRFIAYCKPVKTSEEAVEFINEIRAMHREATHNVYAYVLREDNIARYSDDGEPAGTAGVPVLEVIKKENLTDICVVVTRYFGGILLGVGGLVRAYSKSAKLAVDSAHKVRMVYCSVYSVRCDYSLYGKINYEIENGGYILENTQFEGDVCMMVCVRGGMQDKFEKSIADISCGVAKCEKIEEKYSLISDEK